MGHPVDGCLVVFGWVDGAIHHPFTLVRSKIPFPKSFIENSLPKKGRAFIFATISTRYHSRFIVQVGHETMYAGLENHIFDRSLVEAVQGIAFSSRDDCLAFAQI